MWLAILLSALAMTAIVGIRYPIVSDAFAAATRARHPGRYRGLDAQVRREIGRSIATAAIYGIPAGILAGGWQNRGWTRVHADVHAWPLWYLPISVLLYLFAHDTWFYWTHRPNRSGSCMRSITPAASRQPPAWAAMAFDPIEALTGAVVIPLLVLLIPIHITALGLVLTIMTVMGVTNHMGWEIFPRFMWRGALGGWLITASRHQRHHEQYGCNYGLYFRIWDRLCGTDRGLGDFAKSHARAKAATRGGGGDGMGDARGGLPRHAA